VVTKPNAMERKAVIGVMALAVVALAICMVLANQSRAQAQEGVVYPTYSVQNGLAYYQDPDDQYGMYWPAWKEFSYLGANASLYMRSCDYVVGVQRLLWATVPAATTVSTERPPKAR